MRSRIRAVLAGLPPGQRRFVIVGVILVTLYAVVSFGIGLVGVVLVARTPRVPLLQTIPAYPGASSETLDRDGPPFFTSLTYRATTSDDAATVTRFYSQAFLAGGWSATNDPRSFERRGCPGGFVNIYLTPVGTPPATPAAGIARTTTIRISLITNGSAARFIPSCR